MAKKVIKNNTDKSVRADVLLANQFPEYSRAALSKLFDLDKVKKNKENIKAGARIRTNESIKADISSLQQIADKIDIPIIFEDDNVIVVDKPIGVISHARGRFWDEASVASFVRDRVAGMDGERAGIVHRLDRATSGVMVCAKTPQTNSYLQKQFSDRKTKKSYIAVIQGTLDPTEALIDVPIGRNPKKPSTFKADLKGKSSQTAYKVLKSNKLYSLIELTPQTGRTHQLRVHLNYLGHPIVGDTFYDGLPAKRLFLHAHKLEITIPIGDRRVFTSKIPKEFNDLLK